MPDYVISDVKVRDVEAIEIYRSRAATRYGGRYLVRGGAIERLEGDWSLDPIVGNLILVEGTTA